MKKLSDIKQGISEASPMKPQDTTAQKVNFASSALQLRQRGINPSQVTSAQRKLNKMGNQNLSPSQQYNKLAMNQRNQYFQFGNEVPAGLLDANINMGAFRNVVQRLKSTRQQINKAQADAEKLAAREQQKAAQKSSNQQQFAEATEDFNPPAMLVLKRTGIRNFPDGRHVALYENKQLGLVFSVPYAGKGQTPGEIIPGTQVIQATNEEVDAEDKGEYDYEGDMAISQLKSIISNSMKLKDMLEPDTNLPEWVQAKITLAEDYVVTAANYMEGQQDDLDEEVEPIDEITQKLAGDYYYAATNKHLEKVGLKPNMYDRIEKDMGKKRKAGVDRALDRIMGDRKTNKEVDLQEGTLKSHLDKAEFHNENGNIKLRDYHMNLARSKKQGLMYGSSDKIKANKDTLQKYNDLKKQFSEKDNEFTTENPTIQKLHDQLNPKNKKAFRELLKKDPGKAVDVARKLVPADDSQEQDQTAKTNK
jgi:hypothetical protein